MKNFVLTVRRGDEKFTVAANGENSILSVLQNADIAAVEAPCGGRGVCGKCAVEIKGLVRYIETGEVSEVDGEALSCRCAPAGDCEIHLKTQGEMNIAVPDAVSLSGGKDGFGLAVDIGTTTIAMSLYDLTTGKCIAQKSEMNRQSIFGADVISRIEHCRKDSAEALFNCLDRQLSEMVSDMPPLSKISVVGNTVMQHFAARLNPAPLAVPPFTVQSLFGEHRAQNGIDVYLSKCVSAYVGGDVLAGMLACNLQNESSTVLYVDIGTNGEIVLGNKDGFTCCATAAGPAFEGAEIECGMNASAGAIDSVRMKNGKLCAHVIGEGKAAGICGSGLIDAVAVLLENGFIGKSGRFIKGFSEVNGAKAFILRDNVYLTARDIHKLQLAKAAIRAGIEVLLKEKTVDEIIIAGGFGRYINIKNAVKIGLLPENCAEKIRQVGNAAALGAALLLEPDNETVLNSIAEKCSYKDLSSTDEFSELFIKNLNF